jgi:hypothetical protein
MAALYPTPRPHWIGGWVVLTAGLDTKENALPLSGIEPRLSGLWSDTILTELLQLLLLLLLNIKQFNPTKSYQMLPSYRKKYYDVTAQCGKE